MPRWISWLFLLMMGYLIYTGSHSKHTPVTTPNAPVSSPATDLGNYPKLQAFTNGNRWQRAINPDYIGTAKITDTMEGKGVAAQCADRITMHIRGTLADGANFDDSHDESKPITFRLGDAPYPILNDAIIGMREGGVRQISAPPQQVFTDNNHKTRDDVLLRITLDHVDASAPTANSFSSRTFIDAEGAGAIATCGTPIKLKLTLWDDDGHIAYETAQPITVTLGKDPLPRALATSVAGMRKGEQRTMLLLPEKEADESIAQKLPAAIRTALQAETLTVITAQRTE